MAENPSHEHQGSGSSSSTANTELTPAANAELNQGLGGSISLSLHALAFKEEIG